MKKTISCGFLGFVVGVIFGLVANTPLVGGFVGGGIYLALTFLTEE